MAAAPWDRTEGKIQPWHRDRLAVVYVRQSTPLQVLDHGESTRLQYGLTQRAVNLGWAASRVLVIDEDLGHSASGVVDRAGFQRLVSEVGLDHVSHSPGGCSTSSMSVSLSCTRVMQDARRLGPALGTGSCAWIATRYAS
jgi:hypothetical protein